MNRHMVIGIVIGLVVGLFVGYQAGSSGSSAPTAKGGMPAVPPPGMPGGIPPGAPQPMPSAPGPELQARISSLQSIVARDPRNVDAWVQLGNDYFDTHQPQKAVESYGRALELRPNDPNVLTDQGVMYKDLGQYDKAIANFEKANKADPKHVQSLFNLAVVYAVNLKQNQKAIEAWNRVIQVAPASPQAEQAKAAIADLKSKAP